MDKKHPSGSVIMTLQIIKNIIYINNCYKYLDILYLSGFKNVGEEYFSWVKGIEF